MKSVGRGFNSHPGLHQTNPGTPYSRGDSNNTQSAQTDEGARMLIKLNKGLGFSAAHLIIEHEKCEYLHGHNYRVGVTVEGEPDERGLVVDFLELERILNRLCGRYDHHILLPENNRALKRLSKGAGTRIAVHGREYEFPSENVVWLPVVNTTVEELARVIADEVVRSLSYPNVRRITVWVEEAPGQGATEERRIKA